MISLGVTVLASALLCGAYLKLARRWQLLAHPNERSSHALPTPHGGGVPLYLALLLGLVVAASFGQSWGAPYQLITSGALLLVAVGVLDDLVDLSAPLRFAIYCVCCAVVVLQLFAPQGYWLDWLWVLSQFSGPHRIPIPVLKRLSARLLTSPSTRTKISSISHQLAEQPIVLPDHLQCLPNWR